jgi:hypothetical protein
MPKQWTHVRIEKALHQRLATMAAALLQAHVEGRISLPSDQVEHVTLAHVITRALDELDGHRTRARDQAKRNTRTARTATLAKDVLTPTPNGANP